jgi:hypothetical protein
MTSMVRAIIDDLGMEAVWQTSGTLGKRAFLLNVCTSSVAVSGKRKVLVLDEMEAILGNEAVMADICHVIKHNRCVPIVCISKTTRAARTCDIGKKAALTIEFPPPAAPDVEKWVMAVAASEGLKADPVEVRALCGVTQGDAGHVLQTLRAASKDVRDMTMLTADAVRTLYELPCTLDAAIRMYLADAGALSSAVFETYLQTGCSLDQMATMAALESCADLVDEYIHARNRWDLLEVHGSLTAGAAATCVPRTPNVALERHGILWNKMNLMLDRRKKLRNLSHTRLQQGLLTHLDATDLASVRSMYHHALTLHGPPGGARVAISAGLDPTTLLHLMRLWSAEYKLSVHNKVKKIMLTSPR